MTARDHYYVYKTRIISKNGSEDYFAALSEYESPRDPGQRVQFSNKFLEHLADSIVSDRFCLEKSLNEKLPGNIQFRFSYTTPHNVLIDEKRISKTSILPLSDEEKNEFEEEIKRHIPHTRSLYTSPA